MIKTIIIDDEEKARENLCDLLEEYCPNVEVLAREENVKGGIAAIKRHKPDLVFLDVKMQGETGFDLLDKLDKINFELIFATAHDHYAIQAFKACAIDYLMKPINIEELEIAVSKVSEKISSEQPKLSYEILKENFKKKDLSQKKIAIPTSEGLLFIRIKDIIRCEADGSYTQLYLSNGNKITVSKILKEYEELLGDYNFLRVHQSHLINMEHIKKYISAKGGQVVMVDDTIVGVSRNYKEHFLSRMAEL